MKTRIHAIAGGIGFVMILLFWTATAITELFAPHETVAAVKALILQGMVILIPAMAIAGGSGTVLGRHRTDALASAKKRRMPLIAVNGLLILLPSAWFLAGKAAAGEFDRAFYLIQIVELVGGAANLTMMGLNIRDGLTMTGRIGGARARSAGPEDPVIEERPAGPLVAKSVPRLTSVEGAEIAPRAVMALCRCGRSQNKPFCDGSHTETAFDTEPSPDRTPDGIKVFEGQQIHIHYNRLLCSHAGECEARLNSVFDTRLRPWITPDNGTRDQIKDVVRACPSGALSWSPSGSAVARHEIGTDPGITIERDGPYRVTGLRLASDAHAEGASPDKYVLCRCGASRNKPFCDGSHAEVAWSDKADPQAPNPHPTSQERPK
ncbi:CDGSH iron-sulfur domain-containing protein [Dinoroseobacter sp. S124A]|uniref:CDGSH iron-sulfur domain-containing protein n=1 Tax=Dinoroseobacter sp. S124A TaxID=3415128 RepID=UPI003C7B41E3